MSDASSGAFPRCRSIEICQNPIFIIGSPRSGTTILARSLGRHSHLWYACEGHLFDRLFPPQQLEDTYAFGMEKNHWVARQNVTREEFLESMGLGINALYTSRSGGKRWIEKTPANVYMLDVLADMFPGALFLHILRDGRHVVHSMVNYRAHPQWQKDFHLACAGWSRHVTKAMEFAVGRPDRCLTIRNEGLAADPEQTFDTIFRFLLLPSEDAPLDYARSYQVNSSFQLKVVAPTSLQRRPDPWQAWTTEQQRIFLEEAGPAMLRYGLISEEEMCRLEQDAADPADPDSPWLRASTYYRTKQQIRSVVEQLLPPEAVVLVVSKGDEALLQLAGRTVWHFPQTSEGTYAGSHPADSHQAIRQLEELRARGASFLLLPEPTFWWLEHYTELSRHLNRHALLVHRDINCILYAL